MKRYSTEQCVFFVISYYENGRLLAETVRKARTKYGRHLSLSHVTVKNIIEKFEATGSVKDMQRRRPSVTVRTSENIAAVRTSVQKDPTTSNRHRAQELGLSVTSLRRILKEDLRFYPYKLSVIQML